MAGTLSYRLQVDHVYQRRFDSVSFSEALKSSHWYIISRRPSIKILRGSDWTHDQVLTVDFVTRDNIDCPARVFTLGGDFSQFGTLNDFQVYEGGAYFSVCAGEQLIHGDAWALASLLSGARPEIAKQEVLYIGQAFGRNGEGNAWKRVQNHEKLQRIYEDHVTTDFEIFVTPLSCERIIFSSDDHIEDAEEGPDLASYLRTFADRDGWMRKASVDLVEHSLISYFAPPYNQKLKEWRAAEPTTAMRKMRSAGFRLLNVHLRGWWGLARFHSAQEPNLLRSHFIAQDLPPEPRRPVLRGIAAEQISSWRFEAMLVREGKEYFANLAEQTGTTIKIFGDEAPTVRTPAGIMLGAQIPAQKEEAHLRRDVAAHNAIRASIYAEREKKRQASEPLPYTAKSSYDKPSGTISVGKYEDDTTFRLRLNDPHTGNVDSTLIIGRPHSGKSNSLRVIMHQACISKRYFVIPSDPTGQTDFRRLWASVYGEQLVATDLEGVIRNLVAGVQIIEARAKATKSDAYRSKLAAACHSFIRQKDSAPYYTKPSKRIPGILIGIDNADIVLKDPHGTRLAGEILSDAGKSGVGLVMAVSDISTLESDPTLMRRLVSCTNIITHMPDGVFVTADLRARHGEPRSRTWREEGPSFVVYSGPQDTTLELMMAITDPGISPREAQSWARKELEDNGVSELWDWKPTSGDPRSWWTMDLLQAQRWSLRQHQDAWVLMLQICNYPVQPGPDTLRWANEAIESRYQVDLEPWHIGPSTGAEGLSVFYADIIGNMTFIDRSEEIKQFLLRPY